MILGKKKKLLKITLSADGIGEEALIQKTELVDNRFTMGMELKVNEGFAAVFSYQGRVTDVLKPGEYRLSTRILPHLTSELKLEEGYDSLFIAQLLFVRLERLLFNWDTSLPLLVRDDRYGLLRVLPKGNVIVKITDPQLFCDNIAFIYSLSQKLQLQALLNELIIAELNKLWEHQRINITQRLQERIRIASLLHQVINGKLKPLGLLAEELMISSLTLAEPLEEYLSAGGDIDQYNHQYRVAQLLKTTALNRSENRCSAAVGELNTVNIIVER